MRSLLDDIAAMGKQLHTENPNLRWGQAYANALKILRPQIAEQIHGTQADPFYDDGNLAAFWYYLCPPVGAP